jgi:hypothetical protein
MVLIALNPGMFKRMGAKPAVGLENPDELWRIQGKGLPGTIPGSPMFTRWYAVYFSQVSSKLRAASFW